MDPYCIGAPTFMDQWLLDGNQSHWRVDDAGSPESQVDLGPGFPCPSTTWKLGLGLGGWSVGSPRGGSRNAVLLSGLLARLATLDVPLLTLRRRASWRRGGSVARSCVTVRLAGLAVPGILPRHFDGSAWSHLVRC